MVWGVESRMPGKESLPSGSISARCRHQQKNVLSMMREAASRCQPPYPSSNRDTSLTDIIRRTFHPDQFANPLTKKITNETLCRWLDVTPEVARELRLHTIVPDQVREARKPPAGGNRAQEKQRRHAFIKAYVSGSPVPSYRDMAELLAANGLHTSHVTVKADYEALGISRKDAS
jgi:hypothetical protein